MSATAKLTALALLAMLLAATPASAADIQDEEAWPRILSASLEAQVDPLGEATTCEVKYTTAAAFAEVGWAGADVAECSPDTIGAPGPAQRVEAELSGLDSDTEYRYRFVATTTAEVTEGTGGSFHTFGVEAFTIEATENTLGDPDSAAGSHPYELVTRIVLPHGEWKDSISPAALAKDILAELPPGLIGDPTAADQCPARLAEERRCSGDSQVGVLKVRSAGIQENFFNSQIFNMAPAEGQAARLGGEINLSTSAYIGAGVRTGDDYGISAGSLNLPIISNPFEFEIRLWGVPASPDHNALRSCAGVKPCSVTPGTPERAFLRNPTECAGPLQARVKVSSYNLPGTFFSRGFEMPAISGCEELEFEPTLKVQPTTTTADSPSGLDVDLHVPQSDDPTEEATPDLRDAVVSLPQGFTLNPSSANGLQACTVGQFGLTSALGAEPIRTTADPAVCPNAAKIGMVEVDTPLLDHPLPGAVYVATPYSNPFNSLLAIYIAVADPISGVVIKLAGEVEIGPGGQLTTTFSENPQLPFDHFRLRFFGGDQAVLRTPALCGSYETTSTLTPWSAPQSGPPASLSESHAINQAPGGGACPTVPAQQPNAPAFEAGSEAPVAGAFSPFVVRLSRADGSQEFSALTVSPPPGLLGSLAGIPYCSDAALAVAAIKAGRDELAAPSCSPLSRVGSVVVGAGAGPKPYYVTGQAYLAGPYKGAPLSLAVVTPAVAGPYDLGTVVVRAALHVDPRTAQITVVSDPIPTELKGIPVDVRSIAVNMDRPGFTLNPTSCEAMSVTGQATSVLGSSVALLTPFRVGNCKGLGFKPRIGLRLFGGIRRGDYQGLRAVVRPRLGDANIGRTVVRMPRSAFLAQEHIRTVCTRVQFAAESCPKGAVYGRAIAWSPLLDYPLRGNVYLRSSDNTLPDLVADLRGPAHQPLRVELVGRTDSVKGALRNTFDTVPDAPVSYFRLQLFGGKKGLIVNSRDICAKGFRAGVRMDAHNGRRAILRPALHNKRCKAYKRKLRRAKAKRSSHRRVARR